MYRFTVGLYHPSAKENKRREKRERSKLNNSERLGAAHDKVTSSN